MSVINLRPVGWDGMTPRQWGTLRDLIWEVYAVALRSFDIKLMVRAQNFLVNTEGRDV